MLFLAFPFAVKLVYKRKVSCVSKADTVDNPGAVICIARFIWHVQFTALLLFGNNRSDKQRFCQEIVTSEQKANDHIIISVCSQMITYKAVKANSWLQYWLPYLNIENGQTSNMIMMTARVSSLIFLYSCRGYESMSALSTVSTFVLLVRVVLIRLIFFSLFFSLAFDRPIMCSFSLLQKVDSLLIIYNAGFKNDLAVNDFRTFYVLAPICTRKAVSLVIIITP